jgi:hypothetical protein
MPLLDPYLKRVQYGWDEALKVAEEKTLNQRQLSMSHLKESIAQWFSAAELANGDKQAVWQALISGLSTARQELENEVFANVKGSDTAPFPAQLLSRQKAMDLACCLESYDHAVTSIQLPYESDSEVMTVGLRDSLIRAANIKEGESTILVSKEATKKLTEAVKSGEAAREKWKLDRNYVKNWSPGGLLCEAVRGMLRYGYRGATGPTGNCNGLCLALVF